MARKFIDPRTGVLWTVEELTKGCCKVTSYNNTTPEAPYMRYDGEYCFLRNAFKTHKYGEKISIRDFAKIAAKEMLYYGKEVYKKAR